MLPSGTAGIFPTQGSHDVSQVSQLFFPAVGDGVGFWCNVFETIHSGIFGVYAPTLIRVTGAGGRAVRSTEITGPSQGPSVN